MPLPRLQSCPEAASADYPPVNLSLGWVVEGAEEEEEEEEEELHRIFYVTQNQLPAGGGGGGGGVFSKP
jgi:hypothetical protein